MLARTHYVKIYRMWLLPLQQVPYCKGSLSVIILTLLATRLQQHKGYLSVPKQHQNSTMPAQQGC